MSRFTTVLLLAQQRRAREAETDVASHADRCLLCKTGRPCADLKVLELAAAMHGNVAVQQ
jgi:hypothetical protein